MTPEIIVENNLIAQLQTLGYEGVTITDSDGLVGNLKSQLERFNKTSFTDKDFTKILNHLEKGNVFEKAKTVRDRFALTKEDGEVEYVQFYDSEEPQNNLFQVTNQITQEGVYKNRYDVTLLINGLPMVQIELKRPGIEIKEAFNQVERYKRHSFWSNYGLFNFVQLFVISNGTKTKYFCNNPSASMTFKQTIFWSDVNNKNILEISAFAESFLHPTKLGKVLANYIVINETLKCLMVLRPYQYYAAEAIVNQVKNSNENGYIWHTTGSGKTLTSFKASQIVMDLPQVEKVLFVVDRKDLDYQTIEEYNNFKKGSVDSTDDTSSLVKQLSDGTKLIVTTIQKLNNAISHKRYANKLSAVKDKKVVFIFDECHRSQFGDTHKAITEFFTNNQLFGFTGTPIFADNVSKNQHGKRTTKDLFGECLHKYVITDAINDKNVLKFNIEYVGRYKKKSANELDIDVDIDVEDIDKTEVFDDAGRIEKIVDYVIQHHDSKTHQKEYSAIFALSSIDNLMKYYDIFQKKKEEGKHKLRIATIFTYGANEDTGADGGKLSDDALNDDTEDFGMAAEPQSEYGKKHSREKLDEYMGHYNKMYGQSFSTKDSKSFQEYYNDLSKRLKSREKANFQDKDRLDIVLVVNMLLTGFDAKMVNTLYVDKNLQYHGLIQAFSRTNRIINEKKSHGNIVCFRNLKKATDDAIALFSNKEAKDTIVMPEYGFIAKQFDDALAELKKIVPTVESADELYGDQQRLSFVMAFRRLMRVKNVLVSYADFDWADMQIGEEEFTDYANKYVDVKEDIGKKDTKKDSILNDIDFELELIHRDEINVPYILKLLANLKEEKDPVAANKQKKNIIDALVGDISLRSKRELIEKFIEENLPKIKDSDLIGDEFEKFWSDQKVLALSKLCEEENLDQKQFKALIETYVYTHQEPIREDVFKCLDNRPSILAARSIGERIIAKMKHYVEVFINGITA